MIAAYAKHWPQRFWGLMFQTPRALWIPHCKQIHTFFMRFSIDVFFLDQQGEIIAIERCINPWTFSSYQKQAFGVLEVPSMWNVNYPIGVILKVPWKQLKER